MKRWRNGSWVNVALFESVRDGEKSVGILRGKGIESRVYFDKLLQTFLFLCPPRAMYRAQVHADDFKKAAHLMETDSEFAPALERAIHCPSCSSLRVNYPQMTRKFFLPTLLLHLGIIFRIIEHEAYCERCHHTWNLPKTESSSFAKAPKPAH